MAGTAGGLVLGLMFAGVGFVTYEVASVGDLGPGAQKIAKSIASAFGGIAGAAPGGTGGGNSQACSSDGYAAWSSGINIPACVGRAYCADPKGGNGTPSSGWTIAALDAWGNATGRRDSTGKWTCLAGD